MTGNFPRNTNLRTLTSRQVQLPTVNGTLRCGVLVAAAWFVIGAIGGRGAVLAAEVRKTGATDGHE
jgi:hypothetical protein